MATNKPWYYLSAYALAVKHGFNGTEQEWLALLKGEQGIQGIQGESAYEVAKRVGGDSFPYSSEQAWSEAVDAYRTAAAESATAAAGSRAAAQAYAEAAGDYVAHIGDPISDIVGPWLSDNIANPSSPPLDTSLLTANAAAEAKATGDAIKAATVAVDELGSSWASQNELYLYHQSIKYTPEYTYHFDDSAIEQVSHPYNASGGLSSSTLRTYRTTTPVDYDPSMVIHVPAGSWSTNAYYSYAIGHIDNGVFVNDYSNSGSRANGCYICLERHRTSFKDVQEPKVVLQVFGSASTIAMLKSIKITRANPYSSAEKFWRPFYAYSTKGRYIPNYSSALPYQPTNVTALGGRDAKYFSTRGKLYSQTSVLTDSNVIAGESTITVSIRNNITDHTGKFVRAYSVKVFGGTGTARKSRYLLSSSTNYTVASDGTLTIKSKTTTDATDTTVPIDKVVYEFVSTLGSPITVKGCYKWLYAGGAPIDAIFYDAAGDTIAWYDDGAGNLANSVNNCLDYAGITNLGAKLYPSSIEIPANAVSFHMAVYGVVGLTADYTPRDWTWRSGTYHEQIAAYGVADHAPVESLYIGRAIRNANKLCSWTYPAEIMSTHYHLIIRRPTSSSSSADYRTVIGVAYAQSAKLTVGTDVSWYTYLSFYRKAHGYNVAGMYSAAANATMGLMCAAFTSAAVNLEHSQGVEWFIQKYGDRLEYLKPTTVLKPGDLVLETFYIKDLEAPAGGSITGRTIENLYTHLAIVTDQIYDRKSGEFYGYERAESANIWSRRSLMSAKDMIGKLSDSEAAPYKEAGDVCICHTWRLPLPMQVSKLEDTYRFTADKETDPLNHPFIAFPPVVSHFGERCIVGSAPNGKAYSSSRSDPAGYYSPMPGYKFYVERAYPKIVLNRKYAYDPDAEAGTAAHSDGYTWDPITVGTTTTDGGSSYYRVDLESYMTQGGLPLPGVYTITAYDSEDIAAAPAVFVIPEHPGGMAPNTGIKISNEGRIVTISDAHAANGKLTCRTSDTQKERFDDIWVRVRPYPATVDTGKADKETLPWGNYMYIPGFEIWDAENSCLSIVGSDKYRQITGIHLINNDFGGLLYRFTGDYGEPIDSDDYTDDDGGAGEAYLQDGE